MPPRRTIRQFFTVAQTCKAVVVSKSLDGELSVEETDHMVREGAEGAGAVGLALGVFAPRLLAAPRSARLAVHSCTTKRPARSASKPRRRSRSVAQA
jgi:hypothetical protein